MPIRRISGVYTRKGELEAGSPAVRKPGTILSNDPMECVAEVQDSFEPDMEAHISEGLLGLNLALKGHGNGKASSKGSSGSGDHRGNSNTDQH